MSKLLSQDGQVTLDEFITFSCDLRTGKHAVRSKRHLSCIAAMGSAVEWWRSMKSQTLRAVVITHFQLMSSLKISFPELDVRDAAGDANAVKLSSNVTTSFFKKALNDATGVFASLNVAVFEFIGCFVGPRHASRLIYTTVTAIGFLLAASIVPWAVRRITSRKRISLHDSGFVTALGHYSSKGQLILIFLVYPALTTTIMRTFVCAEYAQDEQGNPTTWLVDDTVVQCDLSLGSAAAAIAGGATASTTTPMSSVVVGASPYLLMYAYSCAMVIIVVFGFPLFLYYRLWPWRHPFDRMYFIDEDGREKPTSAALDGLDTIVMFRSGVWAMSIVDMFFKFLIVSFIGVAFQGHAIAGVCVAGLCCASIMAFFAFKRPYLYGGGNYISVASYGSLLAEFTAVLTSKLEHDGYSGYAVNQNFKNLLFAAWLLPYIGALADTVNAPTYFKRVVARCCRRGVRGIDGRRGAEVRQSKRDERGLHHAIAAAHLSDHNRGVHILNVVATLLPIVRHVVHAAGVHAKRVRAKQKQHANRREHSDCRTTTLRTQRKTAQKKTMQPHRDQPAHRSTKLAWDEDKDAEATLAVAKELDSQLRSMIEAFSNGGSAEREGGGDAVEGKLHVRNLTGAYRPLYWHHFIDVETAARKLSELAFPYTDVCHRKSAVQTRKPGCVRKSFAKRHLLWGNPVTEQLHRVQEEMGRSKATIGEKKEAADHAISNKDHAYPNMRDIATW